MHICFRQAVSIQKLMVSRGIHTQISLPTVLASSFPPVETLKGSVTIVKMEACTGFQAASLKPWVRCEVAASLTLQKCGIYFRGTECSFQGSSRQFRIPMGIHRCSWPHAPHPNWHKHFSFCSNLIEIFLGGFSFCKVNLKDYL